MGAFFLWAALALSAAFAEDLVPALVAQKRLLEQVDEERIRRMVESTAGPDKFIAARVTITLKLTQKEAHQLMGQAQTQGAVPFTGVGEETKVLPGFKDKKVTVTTGGTAMGRTTGITQAAQILQIEDFVESKDVYILLAKNVKEDYIDDLKQKAAEMLKTRSGKTPTIRVERAKFAVSPIGSFMASLNLFPLLLGGLALIGILMFSGAIKTALLALARSIGDARSMAVSVSAKQETKNVGEEGGEGGGVAGMFGGALGAGGAVSLEEPEKAKEKPFSFITKENMENLCYLMLEETPETIALILTYLDPELQGELLASLPPELQLEVAVLTAQVKLTTPEDVAHVEANLKRKIDYLIGGLPTFVRTLERASNKTRRQMLAALEKQSPRLARLARQQVFMFEDIANLDDRTVQFILREVKMEDLARGLKDPNAQAVLEKIARNMSEGGRARLKEEMDFGRPFTEEEMEKAQREVEGTVKEMARKGMIVLKQAEKKAGVEMEGRIQRLEIARPEEAAGAGTAAAGAAGPSGKEPPQPQRAMEYYNAGVSLYTQGKLEDAISYFQAAVRFNPSLWQAWQSLGSALYSRGRVPEAVKAYEKALEINPANSQLRAWLAAEKQKSAAVRA